LTKQKIRVENFKFKLTGKTSELDDLTARLKDSFEKLTEMKGKTKN
jgi:hypothetical protein